MNPYLDFLNELKNNKDLEELVNRLINTFNMSIGTFHKDSVVLRYYSNNDSHYKKDLNNNVLLNIEIWYIKKASWCDKDTDRFSIHIINTMSFSENIPPCWRQYFRAENIEEIIKWMQESLDLAHETRLFDSQHRKNRSDITHTAFTRLIHDYKRDQTATKRG